MDNTLFKLQVKKREAIRNGYIGLANEISEKIAKHLAQQANTS